MTWEFRYQQVSDSTFYQEQYDTWTLAKLALTSFIDQVHPQHSFNSLKTMCENFPIENSVQITDGVHIFSIVKGAS